MSLSKKYKLSKKFKRIFDEGKTDSLLVSNLVCFCVNVWDEVIKDEDHLEAKYDSKEVTEAQIVQVYWNLWTQTPENWKDEWKQLIQNLLFNGLIEATNPE